MLNFRASFFRQYFASKISEKSVYLEALIPLEDRRFVSLLCNDHAPCIFLYLIPEQRGAEPTL